MGDGVHNTRLKSLDEAVKQLQEQSVGHAKAVESINTALQDIVTQLASLRPSSPAPSLVAGSPSSVLGQSSVPLPQTFYQHTPPPPTLNRQPPVHQVLPVPPHGLNPFRRDKPAPIDLAKFDGTNAES